MCAARIGRKLQISLSLKCDPKIMTDSLSWLDQVRWNNDGLVPAIAQDAKTGRILMMAWMNREALETTAKLKQAVYFSRSRNKLWHKGETSHHVQNVQEI